MGGMSELRVVKPRWLRERLARRQVSKLRAQCVDHWAAIGLDQGWTAEHDDFFLRAARRRHGLST